MASWPGSSDFGRTVFAAAVVMFAEGFNATMSFPFASFMVEHLTDSNENLGRMTGFFFTAYPIGSLLSARIWAAQANIIGRRTCLLTSLCFCTFLTMSMAFCQRYKVMLLLRFLQGLLSCSLPMARTYLRERVHQLEGNQVKAFSLLQSAFATSCVLGPASGGFLYGWRPPADAVPLVPWALPCFMAVFLYGLAIICSYLVMVETADLNVESELRRQSSTKVSTFGDSRIVLLLIMVAGHSYVFTGWETGYPLLARRDDLENWTSSQIGITFLVGSSFLLMHTLFTYAHLVKSIGLNSIWCWSWVVCIIMMLAFPRILKQLLDIGFTGHSTEVVVSNYVAQILVSVLQGSNFTTLQLMINDIISVQKDAEYALPLANSWVVTLQALARAFSPVVTGTLISNDSPYGGVLAFDALAGIATICCLVSGRALQKMQKSVVAAMEKSNGSQTEADEAGYLELKDTASNAVEIGSTKLLGYVLTAGLAAVSTSTTFVTGIASSCLALPGYTENFMRCFMACCTMGAICVRTKRSVAQDPATMWAGFWLSVADWFFLWGYVKCLRFLNTDQYSAVAVSMTPIFSIVLGALFLREKPSFMKLVGMIRNVVVVILVLDPLGFFASEKTASDQPSQPQDASSGSNLMVGFSWAMVACLGTVFMRIVQRRLTHVPGEVTSFWCFAINTVLWFPPGSIPPEIRISFLWPETPQDAVGFAQVPIFVWACTAVSGLLGALMISGQAFTLRYIDVGTFSNLIQPLNLVFSLVVVTATQKTLPQARVMGGVLLAILGIAIETFVDQRSK